MGSFDREKVARRQLSQVTDPVVRLHLMLGNELGDELIKALPALIEQGRCSFQLFNEPCPVFAHEEANPVQHNLYLTLQIGLPEQTFLVNYDGLMLTHGDTGVAAELAEQIVLQHLADDKPIKWAVTEADVYAMRRHYPAAMTCAQAEVAAFTAVLCTPQAIDKVLMMLPGTYGLHGVPAEERLCPLTHHLFSLPNADQVVVDEMVRQVFSEASNGSLYNLDKVVALAGIYTNDLDKVRGLLSSHREAILRLHFETPAQFVRSTNLRWLLERGLLPGLLQDNCVIDLLTEYMSKGRLLAVKQFLYLANQYNGRSRSNRVAARVTREVVSKLLSGAFTTAVKEQHYGAAAALTQVDPGKFTEDERTNAIELAIAHGQPMITDWDYILD